MRRFIAPCLVFLGLPGCVTMSPEAENVMLHSQITTQLDKCTRLGPVTARASTWGQMSYKDVEQQAKNNLRASALKKYGKKVDSVALVNIDRSLMADYVAHGIAYKCF